MIKLLAINKNISFSTAMAFYKFFRLYKHSPATATRIKYPSFIRFDHLNKQLNNTGRSIELSAFLTFSICKLSEKIFIDFSQNIFFSTLPISKSNSTNQIY